jgi:hypothetical protein
VSKYLLVIGEMRLIGLIMFMLSMFLLVPSVSSMNQGDRAYVSDKVISTLGTETNISSVSAEVGDDDILNVSMVPAPGPGGNADDNALTCVEAATGVFLGVHRDYPEIERMNIALVLDEGNKTATAYCLGKWVDEVQFDGDAPNSDDLLSLLMKVIGTLNGL